MTITIDPSLLLSYYDLKAGLQPSAAGSTGQASAAPAATQVTPWAAPATTAQTNQLVQAALNSRPLFNPSATKLTIPPSTANYGDTRQLFTLFQGLTALEDLATQANTTGISSFQLSQLQGAFARGVQQLQTYLGSSPFSGFSVAAGQVAANQTTTAGVKTETDTYTTGVLATGDPSAVVPAFAGNVQFSLQVTLPSGSSKTVTFNLADMGATPRSMSNVVSYLNSQMQAAGVFTRFADVLTQGTASSIKVNGQTITTPAGPNQYSLQIVGNALETLTFSAPTSAAAVYVTQQAGLAPPTSAISSSSTPASGNTTVSQQLVKLTTDPSATTARVFSDSLNAATKNAVATAAAPDGGVYVLANIAGATQAGQLDASHGIAGAQDVALMKYDSAGSLIWTQTLGATSGSGLGLAVSADGSRIAVTGQATGVMNDNGALPPDATDPTGFVSVFDPTGAQVWSQAVDGWTGGQVNNVAFGSDGSVYVAGSSALTAGLSDQYLAGFSAAGTPSFTTFLGPTTTAGVSGLAVDGSSLITAGVQGGDVVVQSYALQPSGAPVLSATRDLGAVGQGSVAGVSINQDGSIVVAGSTNNGALNVANVGNAYTSGENAFVASLASTLAPSGSDTLSYFAGSGGDTTASAVTTAGGKVYITGQVAEPPAPGVLSAADGFVAQVDPATGALTWSSQFNTAGDQARPTGIAVDAQGASGLDALGLPRGTITFAPNQTLLANSALQAGDQFAIRTNFSGVAQTVTIDAADTLQSLSQKISRAAGFQVSVQITTTGAEQTLKITPVSSSVQVTLVAGPAGKNALPALGLSQGLIVTNATAKAKSAIGSGGAQPTTSLKANYGLGMDMTLSLATPGGVKNALAQLGGALTTVKQIYADMTTKPQPTGPGVNGPVPAYLTAEIANYQAALVRLTGRPTG